MGTPLLESLLEDIRKNGPLTVAAFMERALYDPTHGYYTSAGQRSGRAGDFYTSVDAGPLFGALLAELVLRVHRAMGPGRAPDRSVVPAASRESHFDLVEAGAGNGRLTRDVLDALATLDPLSYDAVRVTLVERSVRARAEHRVRLEPHRRLVVASREDLPDRITGLVIANELLDAFPVHRVRMSRNGLRELFVTADRDGLVLEEGEPSSPALDAYFDDLGLVLPEGTTADISPSALAWVRDAVSRLHRGALLIVDYGREAGVLFSEARSQGTLVSFSRHRLGGAFPGSARRPAWLASPGARDLTAHVDFTSVARVARTAGARQEWLVDQTRLLVGLGLGRRLAASTGTGLADVKRRLAAKTLVSPEGLGGTHRAMLLTKGLAPGEPALDPV